MFGRSVFHFIGYGPANNIARGQAAHWMVSGHKLFTPAISKQSSCTPERFTYKERFATGIIKCRWMKLYKFHIGYHCSGPVSHCDAIASGYIRVGIELEYLAGAAR